MIQNIQNDIGFQSQNKKQKIAQQSICHNKYYNFEAASIHHRVIRYYTMNGKYYIEIYVSVNVINVVW